MTQEQAVVHIAEQNGGRLRFGPAKRVLLEANLIANPKNAASILYTLIQRSGRFAPVRRGEYRLVEAPEADLDEAGRWFADTEEVSGPEPDWFGEAPDFEEEEEIAAQVSLPQLRVAG